MKKQKINDISLRINVSAEANQNVEIFKAKKRIENILMTKEETIDYMLKNFKEIKK